MARSTIRSSSASSRPSFCARCRSFRMRSSRRQAASGRSWAWALHCRGDCQGTWRHSVGCRRNRVHVRDALLIQGATGHQQRVPERGWTNRLSVRSSRVVVMVPPTGSKADKAANQGYISWDHSPQHVRPCGFGNPACSAVSASTAFKRSTTASARTMAGTGYG